MKMNNEMFKFVKGLDSELYDRYLDIDQTLGCKSGLVYVAMQIYLESLIRFVVEVENLDVTQGSLGHYLKSTVVQNYFLIDLEYNELDELSMINSYANGVKHIKFEELDPNKFMNSIKELYFVSKCIYLFYYPDNEQMINDFDIRYYEHIVCSSNRKNDYIMALEEENRELEILYDEQEKKNKQVFKENRSLKRDVSILEAERKQLKCDLDELRDEYLSNKEELEKLESRLSVLTATHRTLKKEYKQSSTFKNKYMTARDKFKQTRETMNEYKHSLMSLNTDYIRLKQTTDELKQQFVVSKHFIKALLDARKQSPLRYLLTNKKERLTVKLNFAEKYKLRELKKRHVNFYNQSTKKVMAF
ncbi:hypothetical protein [Haloplasma contractile]|uniref:Uncharacterized protein n=1 Tax=Haloplasma contractile SSD-17B TaxID=1033810 RepID=U2EAJ9_9MOLU|nr:hypothetical protein [Haloplasma contractile]ERJ11851.1 hypothetical protein HLPCO_002091 [Haloplasma contractile SSD-17B]